MGIGRVHKFREKEGLFIGVFGGAERLKAHHLWRILEPANPKPDNL